MLDAMALSSCEVDLSLVDDDEIQVLNREWRKKNKPTDVLSFPQHDDVASELARATPGVPVLLGDVIISVPTTTRQAKERGHSVLDEATMLLAHGVMHLLGLDHRNDLEEAEMNAFAKVLEVAATRTKPLAFEVRVRPPKPPRSKPSRSKRG
jgi:probable rRNA maturation factor